ncbi:integrase arm-type DNA-binding domain-containing protein [Chromobacterium amazonense]|uniref:integrase arm-type DNA-binding domain-containing protein n=1 Tax=Chromobacterium amazonense TaxID=1382803 RepID=UPI003B96857B
MSPSGGKLWRFRFRFQGKAGILALGKYPAVGLSDARQKAHEARVQLAQGINPSQAKKEAKVVAQIAATNAFELVAREWHEKQLDRWTPDHARRVMDSLEIRSRLALMG